MSDSVFATYSIDQIVQYWIAILLFCSGMLAILYAVWGGFLLVISAGNEEKVKAAINHIRYALLGIVVLILVLFIAPLFLNLFGLPYGQYFQPSVILSTIQEVSANIFGGSAATYDATGTNIDPNSSGFTTLN